MDTEPLFKSTQYEAEINHLVTLYTQALIEEKANEQTDRNLWNDILLVIKKPVILTTLKASIGNKSCPEQTYNQSKAAEILGINRATFRVYANQANLLSK